MTGQSKSVILMYGLIITHRYNAIREPDFIRLTFLKFTNMSDDTKVGVNEFFTDIGISIRGEKPKNEIL